MEPTYPWIDDDERVWVVPSGMKPTNTGGCRGCGQLVLWVTTAAGKRMPLNVKGTSHFATCPKADTFRKHDGPPPFAGIETVEP